MGFCETPERVVQHDSAAWNRRRGRCLCGGWRFGNGYWPLGRRDRSSSGDDRRGSAAHRRGERPDEQRRGSDEVADEGLNWSSDAEPRRWSTADPSAELEDDRDCDHKPGHPCCQCDQVDHGDKIESAPGDDVAEPGECGVEEVGSSVQRDEKRRNSDEQCNERERRRDAERGPSQLCRADHGVASVVIPRIGVASPVLRTVKSWKPVAPSNRVGRVMTTTT